MSVQVTNLVKVYGKQRAVNDISFEVSPGQILGFLGPNGAGKTTTMKVITGYMPQTEGQVTVCGYDVTEAPMEVRKNLGYLPEHNPLYTDMYVREYLSFVAGIHKLGTKHTKQAVDEMIEKTGLTQEYKKKIGALSKGYRQRVGLAQAMIHDPKVLVLDEPTSGLDPNQISEIRNLIKSVGQERTVILSTHIMQEVQAMCDRVVIINKGKLVADNTTEVLQQKIAGETLVTLEFKQKLKVQDLEKVAGVTSVEPISGQKFRLVTQGDIREQLFQEAVKNQWVLIGMGLEEQSLEHVFQELTLGEE